MKVKILFLTMLVALALGSCSPKPEIKVDSSTVTLPTGEIGISAAGFTVNLPWTITLSDTETAPTWLSVDKKSGEAGVHKLKITVNEANPSFTNERKGYINIKAGDRTETITIVQPASIAVEEPETQITFDW